MMKKPNIPKTELVRFLVDRKYPRGLRVPPPESLPTIKDEYREKRLEHKEKLKEIDGYEAKLFAMPYDKLLELYEAEKEKEREEIALKAEEEEKKRFFNLPSADADFEHWSKATYWTLEEAIALSFGKDPEVVNWNKLKDSPTYPPSPFIEKYRRIRDLALRAKNFKQLYDPCLPSQFLAWARRNRIDVPRELIQKIEAQGIVIADWKDLYDKLKERNESLEKAYASKVEEVEQLNTATKTQPVNSPKLEQRTERSSAIQSVIKIVAISMSYAMAKKIFFQLMRGFF
jgi:hypothetical protein